jgi:hypothetical protein
MASTLKLTDLQHPSSGVSAITIGSDNSVSLVGGALSPQTGFKNRIINGAMTIDQRNAGAAVTAYFSYPVDRFTIARGEGTENVTFSAQRSTDAPSGAGFTNSLQFTVTGAETSIAADERVDIRQRIEGFNVADLGFGAAGASTTTLSFWVRSSLTGTFGGSFSNAANNRSYPFAYTISTANTWEYKTVTIAGDTTGTWLKDNGNGLQVTWSLGAGTNRVGTAGAWNSNNNTGVTGQVQLISTSGATFYITGVQLEKGSTDTPFEFRSIGTELALCQRYFCKTFNYETAPAQNLGINAGAINFIAQAVQPWDAMWRFAVQMRATPTITTYSPNAASSNWSTNTDTPTASAISVGSSGMAIRASTPGAAGRGYAIHAIASAEL